FEKIEPDDKHNWINLADNDFDSLLPLIDKDVKLGKKDDAAIFELYSLGVATNRDAWNYDFDKATLQQKTQFFCEYYEKSKVEYLKLKDKKDFNDSEIKFTEEILDHFDKNSNLKFDSNKIRSSLYRPFIKKWTYLDRIITHRIYQQDKIFPINNNNKPNLCIGFIGKDTVVPFSVLAFDKINDLNGLSNAAGGTKTLPLYRYDSEGKQLENITDWALQKFRERYESKSVASVLADASQDELLSTSDAVAHTTATDKPATAKQSITKQDIFHYVYAVLHNPSYRTKYELNLKREFPRIPFYNDFWQWAAWGKSLMDLHINYENQKSFALNRRDAETLRKAKENEASLFDNADSVSIEDFVSAPKTKLKANKVNGIIEIDSVTQLTGIPEIAWEYKLGNRSALEWILDQYKERKPQDATIAEKFNTYKFEDYKESVIDLLKKVCAVSVKTMEIIGKMPKT
ncbi:MAG: type ISP restriction/modification enzyme, partial [Acidobacteriota bacterium]